MLAPGVPLRSGKAAQSSSTYKMYFENHLFHHIKYMSTYGVVLQLFPAPFSANTAAAPKTEQPPHLKFVGAWKLLRTQDITKHSRDVL